MPSSLQKQVEALSINKVSEEVGTINNINSNDGNASASFRGSNVVRGGGSSLRGRSSLSLRGGRSGRGGRFINGGRSSSSGRFGGPNNNDEAPVCKFFLQGRCNAGVTCRFLHSQEASCRLRGSTAIPTTNNQYASSNPYSKVIPQSFNSNEDNADVKVNANKTRRKEYCPVSAAAVQHAKVLQDIEDRSYYDEINLEGPFYSIDVEAIASGCGHNSRLHRIPGRVAMVDDQDNVILDEIVKLDPANVVSYLTPLTGLSKLLCSSNKAKPLDDVIMLVKERLPTNAVLVGQSIQNDIDWLGLEQGKDYREAFDIAEIFRQRMPCNLPGIVSKAKANPNSTFYENNYDNQDTSTSNVDDDDDNNTASQITQQQPFDDDDFPTKYRIFSLRHTCLHLLSIDIQQSIHNPVIDAKYSLILFHKYRIQPTSMLRATRDALHRAPYTPSFVSQYPIIDGVCLSKLSYRYKYAARFIWNWWINLFGGHLIQQFKSAKKLK